MNKEMNDIQFIAVFVSAILLTSLCIYLFGAAFVFSILCASLVFAYTRHEIKKINQKIHYVMKRTGVYDEY